MKGGRLMNIISSYQVELLRINKQLQPTIKIGRDALAFCIRCVDSEWDSVSQIRSPNLRMNFMEKLLHATKDNPNPKYAEFDTLFYKMPSYFRRATIMKALGIVSSYKANYAHWEDIGKVGNPPKLQLEHNWYPVFYNDNMYYPADGDAVYLKLFNGADWVWCRVSVRHTDLAYLQKYWSHVKASAPTLEKRHGKYFLRFAFEEKKELLDISDGATTICAVDLGLNSDAVCTIMQYDGTILSRKFINFPSDKDHLYTVVNRIKRYQREHGSKNVQSFWKYAQRINDELAKKIAAAITDYAVLWSAEVIVFEYLDMRGKKSKSQKITLWRKNGVQTLVEHKAHRCGIHISHICAWGTSKLAFDGSGVLKRNKDNHALATFSNGKQYNCDLSASYNIGARYFLRELLKPLDANSRSQLQAKVPDVGRRTQCTYATLIAVNRVLAA